jgi:hypothetical protein
VAAGLVLAGAAGPELLDSYTGERLPHATSLIEGSLAMGRVSCERDPARAAERDRRLRAAGGVEPWPFPALGAGLAHRDAALAADPVGRLAPQGVVERDGVEGRFDDVVGRGFVLLVDGACVLDARRRAALAALGGRVAALGADVRDVDGAMTRWLRAHGAAAALIRPDFYTFGAVPTPAGVPALVDALLEQVHATGAPHDHATEEAKEIHVDHR